MTTFTELAASTAPRSSRPRRSLVGGVLRTTSGRVGIGLGLLMILVIVFGGFFAPYDPLTINLAPPFSSPDGQHFLGTDGLGRDVLSRVLTGGEKVVIIPLLAVVLAYVIGGCLGFVATYRGGRLDVVIARAFDLLISVPVLLFALVAVAALHPSFWVLVFVLVVANTAPAGRTVRAAVGEQVAMDFVTAAKSRGESAVSILFREIAPNVVAPVAADFALRLTYGIVAIATLSFLGLGTQPPQADWGLMINENRGGLMFSPLSVIAPAVMIALLAISFNLVAEAIAQHVAGESKGDQQ